MRYLAPILCLFLLPGCTGNLDHLRDLNPQADDFKTSLASEYQSYADSEMELYRMFSAEYYAGKGLKAMKGEAVEPDFPKENQPAAKEQELLDARAQLMKLLTDDMKAAHPQKLARAQLLYDCWQHEIERGIDQEKAPCGAEFRSSITELQDAVDAKEYGRETQRIIQFAAKSTGLDDAAKAAVADVAAAVKGLPQYRVQLLVYYGRKASQKQMTDERLNVVRKALVKAGVNERHIRTRKVGGSKVVILSRDGIAMDTKKITVTVKTQNVSKGN